MQAMKPLVWSRHCPMGTCRKLLTKYNAWDDWVCSCGWTCPDDVSSRTDTKSNQRRLS